jgi:hypothetical protein
VLFFYENCTLVENGNICAIFNKKQHFFLHKKALFEKGHHQEMFGPLFSDSTYISDAKTPFEMFGMISFGVDSQTHTVCPILTTRPLGLLMFNAVQSIEHCRIRISGRRLHMDGSFLSAGHSYTTR